MKTEMKNRRGQKIVVVVDNLDGERGLVFVVHGLGGFKEQEHMAAMGEAFAESGYRVVKFDATHSFGESDGDYSKATTTSFSEDLEDVIKWAATQEWYEEPFVLVGHSLGSMAVLLYAEKNPDKVKGMAPIATCISGKLSMQLNPEEKERWKKTGWKEKPSGSIPGLMKRLPWSHMEDRLKYDTLEEAGKLVMPVLLIVGSEDGSTPKMHQELLYEKLPGDKELHVINGAEHCFRKRQEQEILKQIIKKWINKL